MVVGKAVDFFLDLHDGAARVRCAVCAEQGFLNGHTGGEFLHAGDEGAQAEPEA
ncbi:hypothetical protein EBZ70_10150 [bacterium]|nr:hypothetical protein [bacterium]